MCIRDSSESGLEDVNFEVEFEPLAELFEKLRVDAALLEQNVAAVFKAVMER